MFKKEQKFKDYLGQERTVTLRFNISESEMEDLARNDPMFDTSFLAKLREEENPLDMIDVIKKLIVLSYGELSDDGMYFWKDDNRGLKFLQSAAYDAFLEELLNGENTNFVVDFMMNIFPEKFAAEIAKKVSEDTNIVPVNK